jgi:DivIVA domain-containing protein
MPDQSSAASEHALMQEITAPLETLPNDPLAIVEADFPTAMRGYDRHAVDDYVEQVTRLVAELQATRSPEAAVRRALERVGEQISGILQRAHETAEQITAQSRGEAEDRMQHARREAAAIIDAAEERVRDLDVDADRIWVERQRIVADAEELSAQLLAVAREAGERFPTSETAEEPAAPAVFDDEEPEGPEEDDAPGATAEGPQGPSTGHPAWDPTDETDPEPEPEPEPQPEPEPEPEASEPEAEQLAEPEPDPVEDDDPGIDGTVPYRPITDQVGDRNPQASHSDLDDSTHVIPPASEAAQHRRES